MRAALSAAFEVADDLGQRQYQAQIGGLGLVADDQRENLLVGFEIHAIDAGFSCQHAAGGVEIVCQQRFDGGAGLYDGAFAHVEHQRAQSRQFAIVSADNVMTRRGGDHGDFSWVG